MADGGYDITDHRDVDPRFGTLADVDALLEEAHGLGLRVIVDLVANHTSERHPWFAAALAGGPGAAERGRYFFRDGRAGGERPPNDWISAFGGPAWARVTEPGGEPGQWYLHTFAPEQPDVDWSDPEVQRSYDDVVRFWLDRGADGIRVDAAPAMAKAPGLPDAGHAPGARFDSHLWPDSPHWDVAEVHDILRRWRAIGNGYAGERVFVSEAVVHSPERLSQYVRPDEMHTTFNFDFLQAPWQADRLRQVIDATVTALRPTGAPPTWVLSSHDETRHRSRYGRDQRMVEQGAAGPTDLAVGLRRARAAALLLLALPGGAYLYQGEELGLPEVDDLPVEALQDPTWERSGHTVRGRDGCRVPLPWSGTVPPFGFSDVGVTPWLPQPAGWAELTSERQRADPESTWALYRSALRLRRRLPGLAGEELSWDDDTGDTTLAFTRSPGFACLINFGEEPLSLAGRGDVLLASAAVTDTLPTDTAVWLTTATS